MAVATNPQPLEQRVQGTPPVAPAHPAFCYYGHHFLDFHDHFGKSSDVCSLHAQMAIRRVPIILIKADAQRLERHYIQELIEISGETAALPTIMRKSSGVCSV